jgi:DNA-cytosine methyltransferase
MKHGSLFSGIGGFDLAAQWMGWENVFHCEWNEFGQKVLHHYWPKAISYHDITKTDFTIHRGKIDILTGGFPCQPYSSAGKRKGKEDERHLWPSMLRAIREIQPRWVVGENVLGLVNWSGGLVFHEVQADLEAQGYEVWPYVLPAVSVNAPHRRDRVWFVAYAKLYANGLRTERGMDLGGELLERPKREEKTNGLNNISKNERLTPHPNRNGFNQRNGNDEKQPSKGGFNALGNADTGNEYGNAADTGNKRLQGSQVNGSIGGSGKESDKLTTGYVRSNWQKFPTVSPLRKRDDGVSNKLFRFVVNEFYDTNSYTSKNNRIKNLQEVWKIIQQKEIWEQKRGFYSLESKIV